MTILTLYVRCYTQTCNTIKAIEYVCTLLLAHVVKEFLESRETNKGHKAYVYMEDY